METQVILERDELPQNDPQPHSDEQEQAQTQLRRCLLFQDMANGELDAIFRRMSFDDFTADTTILNEGHVYQSLWVLVTGRCEVLKCGQGSHKNQLAILESGSVFGEMSFFESAPHSATVHTLTDVTTMRLTRESFDSLRSEHAVAADKITCNLVRILSSRLRSMDEWTCELVEENCNEKQHKEWQEFRSKLYSSLQF